LDKFAETTVDDNRFSFADQGSKIPFSVSVCCKQTEVAVFRQFSFMFFVCGIPET
jgi:hypothetical protein